MVAYDGGEGAFAARFWWLLTYVGHEQVYILNGGYKGGKRLDTLLTPHIPSYEKTSFDSFITEKKCAQAMMMLKRLLINSDAENHFN